MAKRARGAPQERPSFQASCSKQACLPRSLLRARPRGQEKPPGPSSYQVCATGGPGGRAAPGRAAEGGLQGAGGGPETPSPPTVTLARGCPAWPHGWRPKETCGPRARVSRASRGRAGIPSGHAGRPGVGAGSHLAFSHSPGTSGLMPASSRALGAVPGTCSEGAGRGARGCRAEAGVGGGRQLRDGPGFTDQPQGQTSDRDRGGR